MSNSKTKLIERLSTVTLGIAVLIVPRAAYSQYADMAYCSQEAQVQALAATVRINVDDACGSGFIIYQDNQHAYIVTAEHVVDSMTDWIQVERFYIDQRWPSVNAMFMAEIVAMNVQADLAVLRCESPDIQLPVLRVARDLGQLPFDGFSVGCGNCRPVEVTQRRVESVKLQFSHRSRLIAVSPTAEGGTSGGPLLDRHGEVIGICILNKDGRAWFSSLDALHELLDEANLTQCYAPSAPPRFFTLISIAAKLAVGIVAFSIVGLL